MSGKTGRRKSKAAQLTAERRAARGPVVGPVEAKPDAAQPGDAAPTRPEVVEYAGGGGMMMRMRGGFQSAVGAANAPKQRRWLSTVVWLLILGGAVVMFMRRYL